MTSKTGCARGQDCTYCHLLHCRKNRSRPSKSTRVQCKRLVASVVDAIDPTADDMAQVARQLGTESSYLRAILHRTQQQLQASQRPSTGVEGSSHRVATMAAYLEQQGAIRP